MSEVDYSYIWLHSNEVGDLEQEAEAVEMYARNLKYLALRMHKRLKGEEAKYGVDLIQELDVLRTVAAEYLAGECGGGELSRAIHRASEIVGSVPNAK